MSLITQLREDNLKIILDIMKSSTLQPHIRFFPCWIFWFLWKSRNKLVFEQRSDHPSEDSKRAEYAIAEWLTVFPRATSDTRTTVVSLATPTCKLVEM